MAAAIGCSLVPGGVLFQSHRFKIEQSTVWFLQGPAAKRPSVDSGLASSIRRLPGRRFHDACASMKSRRNVNGLRRRPMSERTRGRHRRGLPIPLWSGLALLVAALLPLAVLAACDGDTGEAPTTPETDRQALIALYNATDEDWRNSDNSDQRPLDEWLATDDNDRVILDLSRNQLSGELGRRRQPVGRRRGATGGVGQPRQPGRSAAPATS